MEPSRLLAVAEDIDYFQNWWTDPPTVDTAEIRRGSALLRRLLVEDAAGRAWRQLGFVRSPELCGPDLLAFLQQKGIQVRQVSIAVAAGVRVGSHEYAFIGAYRKDLPAGFEPIDGRRHLFAEFYEIAEARTVLPPVLEGLDVLKFTTRPLPNYLAAPGSVRNGHPISRRELVKHMANEMGAFTLA